MSKPTANPAMESNPAFIDSLFEGIVSFGKTGQMLFCNEAAEQMLGITKSQINDLTPMDPRWGSIHEDGSPFPGHEHPSMYTLRTGVPCKNVIMGITKLGGPLIWITINSQPVYQSGSLLPDSVTCSFVDITAERLMLDELRKSERIQRMVLSSTSAGLYVLDERFHLRIVNKAGEALAHTILAKNIVVGEYYPDFINEDRREIVLGYLRNALKGVETKYEINMPRGGKLLYFLVLFRPIFDEEEKVVGIYLVIRDITREKEAGQQLQQSEKRFRVLFNSAYEFMTLLDHHGNVLEVNQKILDFVGLKSADVVGKRVWETNLWAGSEKSREKLRNSIIEVSKGGMVRYELQIPGNKGVESEVDFSLKPVKDDNGVVTMLIGEGRILDAQRRMELELKMSNERYAFARKATSDAIWDWDIAQNKIYLAEASIKLFGSSSLITDLDTQISYVHPRDRNKYKSSIQEALNGNGDFWQEEYRFRIAKRRYRFVLDKAYIIRDKDKKAIRMIGAMQDVTSHRKLENRLLQEVVNRKREIIKAIISAQEREKKEISNELHDNVSQLLATCNLYLDVLINQPPNPDLLRECKALIKTSIEELRNISHNLTPAAFEEKGLFEIVEEMTEKINQFGALTITLHFSDRKMLEKQFFSEMKTAIYRIIQEQVQNILKHSEASEVVISFETSQNNLVLQISDNGKGFEVHKLKRGLGLNNIQSRVAFFNGELIIKSSPGKGCLIKAIFPRKTG